MVDADVPESVPVTPDAVLQRCSDISRDLGESMAGTACQTPGVLLLEHAGPWPLEALACLPHHTRSVLENACQQATLLPALIRRHLAAPGSVYQPMLIMWVPDEGGMLAGRRLEAQDDLEDIDLVESAELLRDGEIPGGWQQLPYLIAVCAHGRRDACCAELGRELAGALLVHEPQLVWEVSALGPQRFGAGALALPQGVMYGRLGPQDAAGLVEATRANQLLVANMRGRHGQTPATQAAEIEVRTTSGCTDNDQVILLDELTIPVDPARERTVTEWEVGGSPWTVVVDRLPDPLPPRMLSCHATTPEQSEAFSVVSVHHGQPGSSQQEWDERHGAGHLGEPDPTVLAEVEGLRPGRAIDLACGTGRHAVWLAEHGWQVDAVDFSVTAVETLRGYAREKGLSIAAEIADLTEWSPTRPSYDLIVISFVHLPALFQRALKWLAPQGRIVLVGHAQRNLSEGVGGPTDPRMLHDPVALAAMATGARLRVLQATEKERQTDDGIAIDAVLVATKPATLDQPVVTGPQ
ncbi:MAG: hypothetical protein CSA58_11655 [Micrococcales bacterium]|nr:MAG: hypothetical protein CSB46_04805 [Micrococcales bacterium]PIE26024.1 MAG: hypothetical protein CSA58_11655 [Micrococcales bacterium]